MILILDEKRDRSIVPGKRILRAEEFLAMRGSADLIADAEKGAEAIVAKAKERAKEIVAQAKGEAEKIGATAKDAYEAKKKEGYEVGMEEGKKEMTARLVEMAKKEALCQGVFEETARNIVMRSIRRIVGEIDGEERVCKIVHTALAIVRNRKRVVVRVHPDRADGARKAVEEAERQESGTEEPRPPIEVIADGRLEENSCVIDTDLGSVDAGLDAQLAAIRKIFDETFTFE
ncbi:MAG: type III secretion system stator protein SctL [Puniceicoccales bacterium]|jgi:type III secretion protein L|nr:type III secretion system stator protein SctL [Puniceicoccales bacterium]